jgi:glycosyltransferase involved in cell wall biosynthesis
LRIARGIQNKVLEAMAMAKPVVATPAAFAGINAEPGRHLIVAGPAEDMACEIAALLADRARAEDLGATARRLVVDHYRWQTCLTPLEGLIFLDRPKLEAAA